MEERTEVQRGKGQGWAWLRPLDPEDVSRCHWHLACFTLVLGGQGMRNMRGGHCLRVTPWEAGDQWAACGWYPWKMGLGAEGFFPALLEITENVAQRLEESAQASSRAVCEWYGWGAVPRKLPSPVPCLPLALLTQHSASPACLSTAATLRARLASMETTALFPVNAPKDSATLYLGPANWVR